MQKGRPANVATAAHMVGGIVYNNKDNLSAGMIVAGIDDKVGGQVYAVTLGGTVVRQPLSIGGSGSTFIYGLCDHEFRMGMSKEEAVAFVRKMISHAMARDGSSGGVIRTVVISSAGVERGFQSGEWDSLPFSLEAGTKAIAEDIAAASGAAAASAASAASAAAAV
jgi:20S proteasome subunit beta 1